MSEPDRPDDDLSERAELLDDLRDLARQHGVPPRIDGVTSDSLVAGDRAGQLRQQVALLSLGNSEEAHGPALAFDIDDRTALAVASGVANRTAARYLGHVPYATDGIGAVARSWSPATMAFEEFFRAMVKLVRSLLACCYDDMGRARPALVVLISGHGGNNVISDHLGALAAELGVRRCRYFLSMQIPDEPRFEGWQVQHAGCVEHSVAAALGRACLDRPRLERLTEELRDDRSLLDILLRHPALGGMSGYYVFGGSRYDAVRSRYRGLKRSVRDLVGRRLLRGDEALGREILEHTISAVSHSVLAEAAELGIKNPFEAP